eukprot:840369-Pleurochrysis_carterae.AAC.1
MRRSCRRMKSSALGECMLKVLKVPFVEWQPTTTFMPTRLLWRSFVKRPVTKSFCEAGASRGASRSVPNRRVVPCT